MPLPVRPTRSAARGGRASTPGSGAAARAAAAVLAAATLAGVPAAAQAPGAPDCSEAPAGAAPAVRLDCQALAAVHAAAEQMVASGYTPGLAVAIMRGEQLVFSRGYGHANLETDTPVTPETVFPIYSIAKTFTAAAVLQLRDAGRLTLDDRLARYVPDFPRGREVTLRHLLSHTSGVHDHVGLGRPDDQQKFTPDQLLGIIRAQTPLYDFAPGTKYSYSNSNYTLLARVVERAGGVPYRDYVRDSVVGRAPFQRTRVDDQREVVPGRAAGYWRTNVAGRFANGSFHDPTFSLGAGGMRSTAPDLARWFAALFRNRVVSAASLREMTTPARLADGRLTGGAWGAYGLGMQVQACYGHRWVGHGGATTGFTAEAEYYADDDLLVVALANSSRAAVAFHERAARILLAPQPTAPALAALLPATPPGSCIH